MRIRHLLPIVALLAAPRLSAQVVSGRIYDSVAKAPLVGATVQLISVTPAGIPPAETTSDSAGKFGFNNVTPGAYTLGFYHAVLDSIGIDAPFVRLQVADKPVHADLAVPSPTQILTAMCGQRPSRKDSLGVLIGHLYDAETRQGVKNGAIVAEWYSIGLVGGKVHASTPRVMATTTSAGWFAICGVPRDDDVAIEAIRGDDTTGAATVHVPSNGIAQRALFIDKTEVVSVAARDSLGAPDTTRPPQLVHRGSVRVSGTIADARDGRPIAGAQVSVDRSGLSQATDSRGLFTIIGAPGGTQTVLVRAVGYLPERRTVELLPDARPLEIRLSNLKTALDTMRITASRVYARDASGFNRRRVTGAGTYFDSADVARAHVFATSRLLERVNGVQLYGAGMSARVFMRQFGTYCEPTFIIDGAVFPDLLAGDLDMLVSPEEIVGVEVYTRKTTTPAQFQYITSFTRSDQGCGSVIVWTKQGR